MLRSKASAVTLAVGALVLAAFLALPGIQGTNLTYGNYGTQVAWADNDFAPRFVVIAAAQMHIGRVDAGSSGITDDTYYLHFGPSTDTSTGSTDIILAGTSAGSFASSGITFSAIDSDNFETDIRYLESDGKPGYTPGDFVYYSDDTTLAVESSGFADIRLFTGSAVSPSAVSNTAGGIVTSSSQADVTEGGDSDGVLPDSTTFTTSPSATFVVKWADKDGNGQRSSSDPHVISAGSSTEQTFYIVGDLWAATAGDGTFGTKVTSGTTKEIPILRDLSTDAWLVHTSHETSSVAARHLFIHFSDPDGTNDDVLYGDILIKETSGSYATRVTSSSTGLGEEITCPTTFTSSNSLRNHIFYVEQDGVSGYSNGDPVYINRPETCFGGTTGGNDLSANDIRVVSVTVGSNTYAAGTIVASGESDLTTYDTATTNPVTGYWYFAGYNEDRSDSIVLTALSNCKIRDADADGGWDSGEGVYVDSDGSGTVSVGSTADVRLYHASLTDSTMSTKTSVATGDSDLTAPITLIAPASPLKQCYITGGDGTFDAGKSEYIYLSADAILNAGDVCVYADGTCTDAGTVGNTGADVDFNGPINTNDRLFFSWCLDNSILSCDGTDPPLLLHVDDIEVTSGGTRVTASGSDHVPYVQLLAESTSTQRLVRYNKGDSSIIDDVFYLGTLTGSTLNGDDLRVSGFDTARPAGKAVKDSNVETGASSSDLTYSTVVFRTLITFVDPDSNGYDVGDFVVIDMPSALGGGNVGNYGLADVRLTPAGATSGATTHPAGTLRTNTDGDNAFTTFGTLCPTATTFFVCGSSDAFHVYWFDENRDGAFDAEDRGEDRAYILANDGSTESQSVVMTPRLTSVRLVGAGGATGPTGQVTATSTTTTTTTTTTTGTATTTTTRTTTTTAATTTAATTTTTEATTNATTNATTAKPTPGLMFVPIIAGSVLVAAVILVRRRDD